ncbi:MAG TPA: 3-chlorobenzoate-3,4-dioxygenase, partial [Verrucomicrobiales bacterium]|nr:3-chlorobenzoate-3,4-dioxygenase [Verrucomicrobiales bacterium]
MSRREFLIATSATAAIAQVRADAAPLRAAVIGHSGRGDYGHGLAEIFSGRSGIELVGLADPVEEGRLRMAKSIGAPRSYQDWRELLDKERPELVSISMRHADQHAEIALGCLRAGAHVYVEKPFVLSPDEADAVLAEADGRGLRVAVAHTMRMSPAVRQLREALNRGVIGELREMQAFGKQDARAGGEDLMVLGT